MKNIIYSFAISLSIVGVWLFFGFLIKLVSRDYIVLELALFFSSIGIFYIFKYMDHFTDTSGD